jgi:hypothetical protein
MITGIKANNYPIRNNKLRKSLFKFNLYIDASLRSEYDKEKFAILMDTNKIINDVHKAIGKETKQRFGKTLVEKKGKASNPLSFYKGLYTALGSDLMHWVNTYVTRYRPDIYDIIKQDIINGRLKDGDYMAFKGHKMPRVLFLEIGDYASRGFQKKLTIDVEFEDKLYTYTLDSAVLRNTAKHHFSSYITCNGKEYSFDGMSLKPMEPFNWREKLNKNTEWSLAPKKALDYFNIYFNFTEGYQILIYYLTSIKNKK